MTGQLLDEAPNATGFGDTRYAYGQMVVNFCRRGSEDPVERLVEHP